MVGPFAIDTVFPAFDRIEQDFAVTEAATQQLVSTYLMALALMSVVHGPLSDALGRKPVILAGLLVFTAASVGCALAPNMTTLMIMRALQGLSGGASMIVGRTIVRDLYEGPAAARMMSHVMIIFGIAPAIAPIIGGWLLRLAAWPIIFWFLAVLTAALSAVTIVFLPETHPPSARTPLNVKNLTHTVGRVLASGPFHRMAWTLGFAFGALFVYIGAAAIVVVDVLGKGEQDFWVLFVPVIGGMVLGAMASGRLAGRVNGNQLVAFSLVTAVIVGIANICVAAFEHTAQLPYAMVGPSLIALCVALAMPTIQIAIMDTFVTARGTATSVGALLMLSLNAVTSGVLAPVIAHSLLSMAVASTVCALVAACLWLTRPRQPAAA